MKDALMGCGRERVHGVCSGTVVEGGNASRYAGSELLCFKQDTGYGTWLWLEFSCFFQAEDGIRDLTVTGVQTCALPIYPEWIDEGFATGAARGLTHAPLPDHAYWEKWFPGDWVSEMREQIRLWFYSQLFFSVDRKSVV